MDAEGDTQSLVQHVDDVVAQSDVCKAFETAPHIPISGTSSVSMFNERLQMDLLFVGDIIAPRIMDVFSKYSILTRVRSKNPQEVWGAFLSSLAGSLAHPRAFIWMKAANGKIGYGVIFAWNVALNSYFKVLAPIRGFWNAGMALRGEPTIAYRQTAITQDRRS